MEREERRDGEKEKERRMVGKSIPVLRSSRETEKLDTKFKC